MACALDAANDDPRSTIWSWVVDAGGEATLAPGSPAQHAYEVVAVPGRDGSH